MCKLCTYKQNNVLIKEMNLLPLDVDLLVSGGGPAGISAAISAGSRGMEVVLLESQQISIPSRVMLKEAGIMLLSHTSVSEVKVEQDAIRSIVVTNQDGAMEIMACFYIDASEDGEIARKASEDLHGEANVQGDEIFPNLYHSMLPLGIENLIVAGSSGSDGAQAGRVAGYAASLCMHYETGFRGIDDVKLQAMLAERQDVI
jgi:hypothetical protein